MYVEGEFVFFVKNNLPFNEVELENLGEIEAQCISVQGVIITNVYIPPNHSIPKRYLERIFTRRNRRSVFVGDFNAHHSFWSDAVANTNGKYLYDILDAENLAIVNTTDPTRIDISRIKYSLLDLTIVTPSLAPNTKAGSYRKPIWKRPLHHRYNFRIYFFTQIVLHSKLVSSYS